MNEKFSVKVFNLSTWLNVLIARDHILPVRFQNQAHDDYWTNSTVKIMFVVPGDMEVRSQMVGDLT